MTPVNQAKEVVLSCVKAINEENFDLARSLVNDSMTFDGVLGSRRGAEAYFQDMKKMRLKYTIKKAFAEGDDVCLLYELTMAGQTVFCCGWYHLENGKISSLKVIFDPRPVLEASAKS
ncbi:hypothetical protein GCM10028803_42940 [Larkinella knui]|uniref:Nuclear transport factor 2 family protein n=1 Tax=Larkinella knui TaxID=2025310 RepID=A0A3P1CNM4_9BACT|nr:nuclear transport factor 2 family protein [Larkinella knui]RRB14921.1 nuclear transport factor 2 family protein [Larkinella knui]